MSRSLVVRTAAAVAAFAALSFVATAQDAAQAPAAQPVAAPAPAHLGLGDEIPWRSDGQEFSEQEKRAPKVKVDRMALVQQACAEAKQKGTLVLWYVHRIQEQTLQGNQLYRSPVLDVYARQVLWSDPDLAELATHAFVPLRCVIDQKLSDHYGLKPLAFVEPAVVFLDGDGKVVHFVERIRTFHAPWFADLCVRVLEQNEVKLAADGHDGMRRVGRWREALATLSQQETKTAADWLALARLQRLLHQYEQALASVDKALLALGGAATDDANAPRRRRRSKEELAQLGNAAAERGLLLTLRGELLAAQPHLEQGWRSSSPRAAEAGYWHALNDLRLGDEAGAMRRFQLVAQKHPGTPFGKRALANTTLGPDDRPLGAAFTGFESTAVLPEAAWHGLPRDTRWQGEAMSKEAIARNGVEFLLAQQRDDGGFADSRYAYWPNSEITPNVWVAITAIACTALWEHRQAHPTLQERIDRALARGEAYMLDPKHLHRGVNEDCYSDAYRLMYFARRAVAADGDARARHVARMNEIVAAARTRQKPSGFFAHEYENAFATGAVVSELLAARAAGATVPDEMTDKAAVALLSARTQNGSYVYGGKAAVGEADAGEGSLKDAAGRMPICEGTLLQLGRSDLGKLRFALQNFWDHMARLETVRRNDFHSDGELAGFFFFHSVYHASEVVHLLPKDEQQVHWQRLLQLVQQVPEIDGSFLDSHELGRSYGTAMALLTLSNLSRS
jgi:tetratricopeptide (TPR) repeat protein